MNCWYNIYCLVYLCVAGYINITRTTNKSFCPTVLFAGATGGAWLITAAYTDLGNGVVPLTSSKQLVLRQSALQANEADMISGIKRYNDMLGALKNKSYFVLKGVDLKGIKQVTYNYAAMIILQYLRYMQIQ